MTMTKRSTARPRKGAAKRGKAKAKGARDVIKKPTSRFWTFTQNNSGGRFVFEERRLSHFVIIEAQERAEALRRAEEVGIYFDGCASGLDCSCCGDRWSDLWDSGGDIVPTVYGQDVSSGVYSDRFGGWMAPNPEGFIHYRDGRVQAIR